MNLNRRDFSIFSAAFAIQLSHSNAEAQSSIPSIEQWGMFEIVLNGPNTGNPFIDVELSAQFVSGAEKVNVRGFYDGDSVYKIRFSPPKTGPWTWKTKSNKRQLNSKIGALNVLAPSGNNRGPVIVSNDGFHFKYSNGDHFHQIGTTCYSWALQSDELCARTVNSLRNSPFNKIRMCVFANVNAEPTLPYEKTGNGPKDWNPTEFNPQYFRNFEKRITALLETEIQADIILFHPYDPERGFSDMNAAHDRLYLEYIIARFSAYRNVWWSAANEYDLIKTKTVSDWDNILGYIRDNDPHERLRSIHNLKLLYDNTKSTVTHSSIQNGSAVLDDRTAETYRSVWRKPVVFDEICYEGKVKQRWGNLTGEELVMRFWHAHIAGTYAGHSETFTDTNESADNSWLGIGGELRGRSMPRLAFLKKIMEEGPKNGIDPIDRWWERHLGGKEGEYYLRYFGDKTASNWELILPINGLIGGEIFKAEIIDTWNMTIEPVQGEFKMARKNQYDFHDPNRPIINLPSKPYLAIRLTKI